MNACENCRKRMTGCLAGELSPDEESELCAHPELCPACRTELEELSRTREPEGTLPDSNRAEIRRAMSPRRRFSAVRALWKIAAMLVACAAVLCAVLFSAPDERRRVRLDVFQSAEEMRAGVAAAGKRVVPGGAAPESLSLAFGGFPEITEKEISAVAGFSGKTASVSNRMKSGSGRNPLKSVFLLRAWRKSGFSSAGGNGDRHCFPPGVSEHCCFRSACQERKKSISRLLFATSRSLCYIAALKHGRDMTQKQKILSVIIPVYNEEKTVVSLLDKVMRCGVSVPLELIIVNDGSTDSSPELIRNWISGQKKSARVLRAFP